jgi:hypothetical protein
VILAAQSAVDLDIFEIESRTLQIDPDQRENHPLHSFTHVLVQAGQATPPATRLKGLSLLNILIRGPR